MSTLDKGPDPKRVPKTAPATSSAASAVLLSTAPTPTLSGRLQDGFAAAVVMASLRMTARIRSCGSRERTAPVSQGKDRHSSRRDARHELPAELARRRGLPVRVI